MNRFHTIAVTAAALATLAIPGAGVVQAAAACSMAPSRLLRASAGPAGHVDVHPGAAV